MIVAVEGPSAAGKTTWCRGNVPEFVPEYQPTGSEPDGADVDAQAAYWVAVNSGRWAETQRLEARAGVAICDSDPLKLHYSWCLARIGATPRVRYERELSAVCTAFERGVLGFADVIFVSIPTPEVLRSQRDNDPMRRRRHFELHAALSGPLTEWYSAVDRVDPGRVRWGFPPDCGSGSFGPARTNRCDVDFLRTVHEELPALEGA
ncbi:hypothetical protein [Rhodococcoides yunnanense]|uniref:hypothetical protein n=1 Tax=Rhodococcoides yunnanense TaxID=278209 RepID=UPI00093339F7|nr:hypothetical protein [Rhodococcus yunnanensis]